MKGLGCYAVLAVLTLTSALASAQVSVTTWHNDNYRTGQNTSETVLTPCDIDNDENCVIRTTFGKLCEFDLSTIYNFGTEWSVNVSYNVYAQPLVVANSDGSRNVYIVTMDDTVVSFGIPSSWDGTCSSVTTKYNNLLGINSTSTEWPADCCQLGGSSNKCPTIYPTIGILGTPVIDTGTNTMYLDTYSQLGGSACVDGNPGNYCPGLQNGVCNSSPPTNNTWYHKIHAIDVNPSHTSTFLEDKSSYNSPATVSGSDGTASFTPGVQIQRPGLLWLSSTDSGLGNPMVYAGYSMMDGAGEGIGTDPNGFVFGWNASNLMASGYPKRYSPTSGNNADGGGVWEGGAGLAFGKDSSGGNNYLYFPTGNGIFDLNQYQRNERAKCWRQLRQAQHIAAAFHQRNTILHPFGPVVALLQ